jgi:hypothetical protein
VEASRLFVFLSFYFCTIDHAVTSHSIAQSCSRKAFSKEQDSSNPPGKSPISQETRMKRLTPLVLFVFSATAQPLMAQNMNPLMLLSPAQSSPWSGGYGNLSSPFGLGALNPMNPLNSINPLSPWNSYGGMSNPALGLGALGALNTLTPNMMAGNNPFAGNPFAGNSYAGNPFAGSPYMRPAQPQLFGAPAFSPSLPSFPNMPFAAQQQQGMMPGGYYPMQQQMMPQQPAFPFMPYAAPQPQQPSLANFFGMQQQPVQQQPMYPNFFGMSQPAPQQQPAFPNFFGSPQPAPQQQQMLPNFFGMTQPAAQPMQQPQPAASFLPFQLPQAPQAQQPTQPTALPGQSQNVMPFPFFAPQTAPAAAPAPKAAPEPAPEMKTDNAAPPPLDPAAFMQMYMKPQEGTK